MGACNGGCVPSGKTHYTCAKARNRGTCRNKLTIRRDIPGLANIHRREVEKLMALPNDDARRDEAANALRSMIEEIRLNPKDSSARSPAFWH
jgi:hypothetical protein